MLEPLSENNLVEYLTAFADRELDSAQTAAVWHYLAESPDRLASMRWLEDQERLTLAARRSLQTPTPQELRDKMASISHRNPAASFPRHESGKIRPLEWRRILAYVATIAAVLIGGLSLASFLAAKGRASEFLPLTLIGDVDRIHAECARLPEAMHNARFQEIDPSLARTAAKDFGSPAGAPDLSGQGFRLIGAGPCPASASHVVHLLYRSLHPGSMSAVSIFVESDSGQYQQLKAGRVYRISEAASPFPLIAWRSGGDVYFLVADTDDTETAVFQKIHPTPAVQIETIAMR